MTLVLWFLILLAPAVMANEKHCLNAIESFLDSPPEKFPVLAFQNSHGQLQDSLQTILKTVKVGPDLKNIPKIHAEIIMIGSELRLAMSKFYPQLPVSYVEELSLRLQKVIAEDFGIRWSEHAHFLSQLKRPFELNQELFLNLPLALHKHVEVSREFDIPTIAGYSKEVPWSVYLDRDLPEKSAQGVPVLWPLLLHETVEKSLIEHLKLEERVYFRTHQLAQRLEKAWIEEAGFSWRKWQHEEISQMSEMVEAKKLTAIAPKLDPIPYLDAKLLNAWSKILQHYNSAPELFTPRMVAPLVLHLEFNDQVAMGESVFRFQEFFESPYFKGKIFGREEFKNWFFKENKTQDFTYTEVDAFNFPSDILAPFFRGDFNPLTENERALINIFSHMPEKFYITISLKGGDPDAFHHEMSHALYFLDQEYRMRVDAVLVQYDLRPVQDFIVKTWGNYHQDVMWDEAHAWILHNEKDLIEAGFDTTPYKKMRQELQQIYQEKKFQKF